MSALGGDAKLATAGVTAAPTLVRRPYDPHRPVLASFATAREDFINGAASPRGLLEQCLAAFSGREAAIQAFVAHDVDAARRSADASAERYRAGRPLSPIDGCPIGVKDIIETADFPTEMGSPIHRGQRTGRDAACVRALRAGGAVILGKTVTTEFGFGVSGPTTNPFDKTRTPGGSSSGSGAAVGAGMLPAALATHTMSSIIRPAAYCGAYGFKPSFGAINGGGVHALTETQDHVGVIAASVADAWMVAYQCSAQAGGWRGCPPLDGGSFPPPPLKPERLVRVDGAGWLDTDAHTRSAFDDLVDRLRDAGIDVVGEGDDPLVDAYVGEIDQCLEVGRRILAYEMRWPMFAYRDSHAALLGPRIVDILAEADGMTASDYRANLGRRDSMRRAFAALAQLGDAVITLACAGPAPAGLAFTGHRYHGAPSALLGAPAFSLPLLCTDSLPVGVQLIGQRRRDRQLAAHATWLSNWWLDNT